MFFFFFNDTATTEIYTLSLHDALPIWGRDRTCGRGAVLDPVPVAATAFPGALLDLSGGLPARRPRDAVGFGPDRKSTRLNSSHSQISYAVFCLKKKNIRITHRIHMAII